MKAIGFRSWEGVCAIQPLAGKESVLFFQALFDDNFAIRFDTPLLGYALILIEDSKL